MTAVTRPADINPAFATAYNAGKVEAFLSLYEPGAVLLDRNGNAHRGHEAIRGELEGLLRLGGRMTSTSRYAIVTDGIALLSADWAIETTDGDGKPLRIAGRSAEVARQQPDGSWLYVSDHPFGA